ncbi:cytochrome c-type biogenesis protein [Seinonella peptonophila]|uniref:Cytochrome c-type biogenesis protein n=2 Tax=Seinonella peptonophila TaxID=112248 RepID=A0A1M4V0U0_9BACL|nr:cytochrome c-type biogenesis protein [Seinonella peptonophila]
MENVSWWLAFGAGILSFISPCSLPLYPSYLSYITGVSVAQLRDQSTQSSEIRRLTIMHTLFFILGFSIIFYALGFTVSWIGQFFSDYKELLRMLGGILIIVMGLFLTGLFQPTWMMKEKRFALHKKKVSYLSSFLVGVGFSAGWTPCLGPILASVLGLALTQPSLAFLYITLYTLGFAIPFFLMALFIGQMQWLLKYTGYVMKIGGGFLILFGILLYTDQLTKMIAWFARLTGGFTGF